MYNQKFKFIQAVLGDDGARALKKAAERSQEFENAILPRTILSWLGLAARFDFEGEIPGVENTYLQFSKAEDRYSGSITISDDVYSFERASLYHVAASVAVALGADHDKVTPELRDLDLANLGKNIDTLVKARVAVDNLRKRVLDPQLGYQLQHEHHDLGNGQLMTKINAFAPTGEHVGAATFTHGPQHITPGSVVVDDDHQRRGLASAMYSHAEKMTGKRLMPSTNQTTEGAALWSGNQKQQQFGKAAVNPGIKVQGGTSTEEPGPAAFPTAPNPGPGFAAPQLKQTSRGPPKLPGMRKSSLRVTKAQADHKCSICAVPQLKGGRYVGCYCFRDLAKSVKVTADGEGFNLEFKADWDEESILTLAEAMGKNR